MTSNPPSTIQIRKAQPSDAAGIAQVHVESWKITYAGILPEEILARLSHNEREQRWRNILSDPDEKEFVFVAETTEGQLVGFACGGRERHGDPVYQGEVSAIYLLPRYQRQGIGRKLMAIVAQELLRRGFRAILVWVLAANPSRGFYEALGGCKLYEGVAHVGHGGAYPDVAYAWDDIRALLAPHG